MALTHLNNWFCVLLVLVCTQLWAATTMVHASSLVAYNTNRLAFTPTKFLKLHVQAPAGDIDSTVLVPVKGSSGDVIVYKACFPSGFTDTKSVMIEIVTREGEVVLIEQHFGGVNCETAGGSHYIPGPTQGDAGISTDFIFNSIRGVLVKGTFL
jgi:hypothetical protein